MTSGIQLKNYQAYQGTRSKSKMGNKNKPMGNADVKDISHVH